MTEDMRERFEKWHVVRRLEQEIELEGDNHFVGVPLNNCKKELVNVYQAPDGKWAALVVGVISDGFATEIDAYKWAANRAVKDVCQMSEMLEETLRGDSLSGKGEATKIPTGSTEPTSDVSGAGKVQDAAPSPTAAPDRAEELAREIHCPNCINCIVKKGPANQCASEIERIASLLREAEGRWIPVSERLRHCRSS